jgi:hypothetical protein
MIGWIKLHRKLTENPIWTSEVFTRGQAWVDLLLLANHEYGFFYLRDHKVEVQRGQVGYSQLKLSERWQWSRTKVRKFLNDLEKEQQIIQQQSHSTSIITIINYEEYQKKEQLDIQQEDNRKTTGRQQEDTNKNNKEEKKNEEESNNDVKKTKDPKKKAACPSMDDVIIYFKENGYKESVAKKAFSYYDANDWKDSTGNQVKSWKQKMIGVWFKDENKETEHDKAINGASKKPEKNEEWHSFKKPQGIQL